MNKIIVWLINKYEDRRQKGCGIDCYNCEQRVVYGDLRFSKGNKDNLVKDCCVYCR